MKLTTATLLLFFSLLPGCSDRGEAAEARSGRGRAEGVSGGTVALGIRELSYRPMAVGTTAALAGTISVDTLARDSVIAVTRDQQVCGDSAVAAQASQAGVLVWVDGVSAGRPLPEVRRQQIALERCRFAPRVLGVVTGTTINLLTRDRAVLTSRFYREGAPDAVAEIHTVDAGQVVPSELIAAKPGVVEIRTVQQPWSRGFIAVFDHPYFAVTDESGRFTIDSLPPGTYTVKVWQERMSKPMEQRVVIGAGGTGRLDLTLSLN